MVERRAYWKGYLKLSLVTVALFPASSQRLALARLMFHKRR